jgi:hypothetical protein
MTCLHFWLARFFSRPPYLGARRRRLLSLCIDAGPQSVHEIDHLRRRTFLGWLDLFAGFLLFKEVNQRILISILELRRIEVTSLRPQIREAPIRLLSWVPSKRWHPGQFVEGQSPDVGEQGIRG